MARSLFSLYNCTGNGLADIRVQGISNVDVLPSKGYPNQGRHTHIISLTTHASLVHICQFSCGCSGHD